VIRLASTQPESAKRDVERIAMYLDLTLGAIVR
jgi:hypothetical protein